MKSGLAVAVAFVGVEVRVQHEKPAEFKETPVRRNIEWRTPDTINAIQIYLQHPST